MDQRKPNMIRWYSLGLAGLLCVSLLVIMTGTTFARYRDEKKRDIYFTPGVPDQIHIGTVSVVTKENDTEENPNEATVVTGEALSPESHLNWERKEDQVQLEFSVGNGLSDLNCSANDQVIRLRMIGSLGLWSGTQVPTLYLELPPEVEDGQGIRVAATVRPIVKESALHFEYGDGWVFTFLDEYGEELQWELAGEELSYVNFTITIDGEITENLTLLQPYVISEVILK